MTLCYLLRLLGTGSTPNCGAPSYAPPPPPPPNHGYAPQAQPQGNNYPPPPPQQCPPGYYNLQQQSPGYNYYTPQPAPGYYSPPPQYYPYPGYPCNSAGPQAIHGITNQTGNNNGASSGSIKAGNVGGS